MMTDYKQPATVGGQWQGGGQTIINDRDAPDNISGARSEMNASLLRAARSGNVDKVIELLDGGSASIDASNPNGLNALHLAAKEGYLDIVKELIIRRIAVDAPSKKGNTALHIASLAGHEEIANVLVQNGARVNVQSTTGFTPLYMASQENHADVVKFLLDHGANQALATEDGFTALSVALQQGHNKVVAILMENDSRNKVRLPALHVAAKKDDVRAATLLLQSDPDEPRSSKKAVNVNDATKSGFTPLHIAAHYGSSSVAQVLIHAGADVEYRARNSITPLHVASKWGRANIVGLLTECGANLECKTRDSLTPLHCASRSGHDSCVDILLDRGSNVSAKTKNGLTALHMAAQGDHVECARILLFHKAQIDDVTMDYLTALHVAAHCGNVKMAKLLLDSKCEVNARALNGFTPLHVACKKNRIKVIELLLRYGAIVESTTESGLTPLHVASFMGHAPVVTYLLENGAETETQTVRGETALHLAARANQTEVMRILLRNNAQVDARAKEMQTPLHVSSRLGNVDGVQLLLQHGAARDAMTKDQYTPLHIAVKEGHEQVVKILLDNGAKQNITTKKGFTPLHIAAKTGDVEIAKLLLAKNAEPNIEGKNGLTPLHVATHYNNHDVAQLLLKSGATPHAAAKNGYTPLHIAAKKNHLEIAQLLLDNGAKPDSESKNGYTPLHLAAQEGHTEIEELLLKRKADVNCKAKPGLTPMHLAAQEDQVPVAEILVEHGSQIDPQTKAGYTPLHTACHFGQINMIRFLLEHGASVSAETKLGYTPLHQAAQQGHVLVINLLLKYKADPNAVSSTGQTPLSIAQRLGYISVVEILKHVTTREVPMDDTDTKYKVVFPEMMQEAPIDSDEEGDPNDTLPTDRSYHYLTVDDAKEMRYNSSSPAPGDGGDGVVVRGDHDIFKFETLSGRQSTMSSVGYGHDPLLAEMRYMRDDAADGSHPRYGSVTPSEPGEYRFDDGRAQTPGGDDDMRYWAEDSRFTDSLTPNIPGYKNEKNLMMSARPPADLDDSMIEEATLDQQSARRQYGSNIPQDMSFDSNTERGRGVSPMEEAQTPTTGAKLAEIESHLYGSSLYSDASFASSAFNPDNVSIDRHPIMSGFLVSFMVDARGGAMKGCRHSGMRIIVPPGKACQPTRITCKLVRREKLTVPPPLMEAEALASRILQMGPTGAKFSGAVLIEVPHFAALHGQEREIAVLRSDNGVTWHEHTLVATNDAIHKALGSRFQGTDELEAAEELYEGRVARIITTDFPRYFAIITRIRQESKTVGPEKMIMSSTVVPQVQAIFPDGAINKPIKVSLQSQPIDPVLVMKISGDQRVSVSPVVTIEPRHRKFHKPIAIYIPLPPKSSLRGSGGGKKGATAPDNSLRLLCSMTGGVTPADWKDITGSSPLALVDDCVSFTTDVSARFWLMDYPPAMAVGGLKAGTVAAIATDIWHEATAVPIMSKFVVFAKRRTLTEARLRLFCMTDDRGAEKTLESQQRFTEVARSKDIEVFEGRKQYIELAGNLTTASQTSEPVMSLTFHAFRENRLPMTVRLCDLKTDPSGQVIFLPEPRTAESQPLRPSCVLNVSLPAPSHTQNGWISSDEGGHTSELEEDQMLAALEAAKLMPSSASENVSKAKLRLTDIADALQSDWVPLARQLGLSQQEIVGIQRDYNYAGEQALVVLHRWIEKNAEAATGNELERALQRIGRLDIVDSCMRELAPVTDESERLKALAHIESSDSKATDPVTQISDQSDEPIMSSPTEPEQSDDHIATLLQALDSEARTREDDTTDNVVQGKSG